MASKAHPRPPRKAQERSRLPRSIAEAILQAEAPHLRLVGDHRLEAVARPVVGDIDRELRLGDVGHEEGKVHRQAAYFVPVDVEVGESVPYTSQGFTLYLPDNWDVETSDDVANITADDFATGLTMQFESFGEDVPGLFMIPVFESVAPMFAAELGEAAQGSDHYQVLFLIGVLLFTITFVVNFAADLIVKGIRKK